MVKHYLSTEQQFTEVTSDVFHKRVSEQVSSVTETMRANGETPTMRILPANDPKFPTNALSLSAYGSLLGIVVPE